MSTSDPFRALPAAGLLEGAWLAPLCEMSAPPGGCNRCLYVHFCWPCAAGEVAERVGRSYMLDFCCGGPWCCYYGVYGICWGLTRSQLRNRDNIAGSAVEDCCLATCCPPCYLAQALNHLDIKQQQIAQANNTPYLALMPNMHSAPIPVGIPVGAPAYGNSCSSSTGSTAITLMPPQTTITVYSAGR